MATIEERLAALETEVSTLIREKTIASGTAGPWWQRRWGAFKDDPMYDEAMRLGAQYRRSQPTPADEDVPA
jgi:hypothetical protein